MFECEQCHHLCLRKDERGGDGELAAWSLNQRRVSFSAKPIKVRNRLKDRGVVKVGREGEGSCWCLEKKKKVETNKNNHHPPLTTFEGVF